MQNSGCFWALRGLFTLLPTMVDALSVLISLAVDGRREVHSINSRLGQCVVPPIFGVVSSIPRCIKSSSTNVVRIAIGAFANLHNVQRLHQRAMRRIAAIVLLYRADVYRRP